MSSLSREEIQHVAQLARLELSESEIDAARHDLAEILDFMQQLQAVDTSQVEATLSVQPRCNVYREDVVRPSLAHELMMANAPDPEAGAFRIPRILEES